MAYVQKKKPPILSKEEQSYIQEKLNSYKKFFKPLKGEIVYKREDISQECVLTARYYTEEDLQKDAKDIVDKMNAIDIGKKWILISAKVIGKETIDDDSIKN